MVAEQAHVDALLAKLEAGDAVPFTIQGAKRVSALPLDYNRITLEPRFGGELRLTASTSRRGFRIAVRSIGRTYEGAATMRDKADAALRFAVLDVADKKTTPIQFESADPIEEPEAGWYFGDSFYTYVH